MVEIIITAKGNKSDYEVPFETLKNYFLNIFSISKLLNAFNDFSIKKYISL